MTRNGTDGSTPKLTVLKKKNGERAIYAPFSDDNFTNVAAVTLQTNGEIRWASIGPMSPEDTLLFSDAVRLAIHLSGERVGHGRVTNVSCGLCWEIKEQ